MEVTKLKILAGLGALIILLGGGLGLQRLLTRPFRYAGTLEAAYIDISARLAGAITEIPVTEGQSVKLGEPLVKFACEDYKLSAALALADYQRNLQLVNEKFISSSVIEYYKNVLDSANTKVAWCTLTAPINGRILDLYHEIGEWLTPGTKILTLANIQDIWAYIYVPQPKLAQLSYGMKLKGYLPELQDRVFLGEITQISDQAEFTPKNVQTRSERERLIYRVKVSFAKSNQSEILKPGMTIEVVLPT